MFFINEIFSSQTHCTHNGITCPERKQCKPTSVGIVIGTVHPKNYVKDSRFVVLCFGQASNNLPWPFRVTSLLPRQSYYCPATSESTLKNLGQLSTQIYKDWSYNHNKIQPNKTMITVYLSYCTVYKVFRDFTIVLVFISFRQHVINVQNIYQREMFY